MQFRPTKRPPPSADRDHRVLILGATSLIAQEVARLYAAEGATLLLAGRRQARLAGLADDLARLGARCIEIAVVDFVAEADPQACFGDLARRLGGVDRVLLAYGKLGDQHEAEQDLSAAGDIIATNFTSAAKWILSATAYLEAQDAGTLVVLGSLSGDRIRNKILLYSAAKAGLAAVMAGVALRLRHTGARAILIKPGPTETPMSRGLRTPSMLRSTPVSVACAIHRAASQRKAVVYVPGYWRWIMLLIRALPQPFFARVFDPPRLRRGDPRSRVRCSRPEGPTSVQEIEPRTAVSTSATDEEAVAALSLVGAADRTRAVGSDPVTLRRFPDGREMS